MAIRPKIKKSSESWLTPELKAEFKAIDEKYAKMTRSERNSMRNSFFREFQEKIKVVPKKVVEAKIKTNKNAPKQTPPKTGNVTVIPGGSKPKTKTNSQVAAEMAKRGQSRKGGKSSRGGGAPGRGGMLGGGSSITRQPR